MEDETRQTLDYSVMCIVTPVVFANYVYNCTLSSYWKGSVADIVVAICMMLYVLSLSLSLSTKMIVSYVAWTLPKV